jgi:hypothetical protein
MQVLKLRFAPFVWFYNKRKSMKKTNLFVLVMIVFPLLFSSCSKSTKRFKIDTTEKRVEVKIKRFDKAMMTLADNDFKQNVAKLYVDFPKFLPAYTAEILDTAAMDTVAVSNLFKSFLADKTFAPVNKKAMETFADVTDIEKSLSDAYTYIMHYFPNAKLPEIYFFVSGLNRSVIMNDDFIAIGTDFYLGSDYKAYKDFTYKYLMYNMRRECVAADIVSATLFRMFALSNDKDRLLDHMLFRGKVMYLLSVCMPEEKAEDLMAYDPVHWKWCNQYEKNIWAAMIDQKDLFSTDNILIKKYMNDAPFTAPISQESPGRLGTWIGWQIVSSYMKNNPQVGLRDLMKDDNYQKMLENSGYKP